MPRIIQETLSILECESKQHKAVLVSFSGGKDSLAVMDLCLRSFKHVEAFYMFSVPGLACIDEMIDSHSHRFGVKIRQYPHWTLSNFLRLGVYCHTPQALDDFPQWNLEDIYNLAKHETGIDVIATGARRKDSRWRKLNLKSSRAAMACAYPIIGWNKPDVLAYLQLRRIPIPQSNGDANISGIDLSRPSLLWLHDNHPDDFTRLCEMFQFAEAIIWQRSFYGEA